MAEEAKGATPADDLPANKVEVTDSGTLKKKVTVTITRHRIDAKRDEMFGELAGSAQIPGFRIGHAPRRLVEKRFGKEISQDVRNALIGESIGQAIEEADLKTVGEPDLDLESIALPEAGDLEFSFEAEVAPEFDIPELKGIEVTRPAVAVTDEDIDRQIHQWAESHATYEPTDGPAADGDAVTAGAKITIEGIDQPIDRPGLTLRVAPGQIESLPLVDLPKALAGKKAGQDAQVKVTVSDSHPNEDWRGKEATIDIQISGVSRRVVPEVNEEFVTNAGFESLDDLRQYIRTRTEAMTARSVDQAMRQQVEQYLLDKAEMELPEDLLQRHTARLLQRRFVDLLRQGIPREAIDERLTEMKAAAGQQARRDLQLQFILQKVGEDRNVEVNADEVNARVAQIAAQYNRRPERVRQELAADGTLEQLQVSLAEEKTLDLLLAEANITEAKAEKKDTKKTAKKAGKKTEPKSAKKAAKEVDKKTEKKATKESEPKAAKKAAKKASAKDEGQTKAPKSAKKSAKKAAKKADK